VEPDQVVKAAPSTLVLLRQRETGDDHAIQYTVHSGSPDEFINGRIDIRWLADALRFAFGRKAALQALRASEARFRAISDASPLGIFVAVAVGGCVYTNSAYIAVHRSGHLQAYQRLPGKDRNSHPSFRRVEARNRAGASPSPRQLG